MMRLIRIVLCAAIVILWLCAMALIVDHRCSVALSANEITWEEASHD